MHCSVSRIIHEKCWVIRIASIATNLSLDLWWDATCNSRNEKTEVAQNTILLHIFFTLGECYVFVTQLSGCHEICHSS